MNNLHSDLRSLFLNFFNKNQHQIIPSSSLIPNSDPSLLFTNAGMVPFKKIFTGHEPPTYQRVTSCQKCLRAGGKHNDLENVGYTKRHHTFFEMLGNFSFGDYFKEEAIYLAWNFLTKEVEVSPSKLYITVYGDDQEAFDIWKQLSGFHEKKIIRIFNNDNFWSMSETGPCGPCSEIFYDNGDYLSGGLPGSPNADGDRFVEIWNLVFMQFDQINPTERVALPKPCIDTGAGLERFSAVLQGTPDNYETGVLKTLIESCAHLTHLSTQGPEKFSHRVLADHLRSTAFLISEGIVPSNEGRGYVLRRILRRAIRHSNKLGYEKGSLLADLFPVLAESMGQTYPELLNKKELICRTLEEEEERFQRTLTHGLKLLQEELKHHIPNNLFSGIAAFKLYDTYGFPLDLTQDILREQQINVDLETFEIEMGKQQDLARASWTGAHSFNDLDLYLQSQSKSTDFLGYTETDACGTIQFLITDGKGVNSIQEGQKVAIILNQTPFYGESGGQKGDIGTIKALNGSTIEVSETLKKGHCHIHYGTVTQGSFQTEQTVNLYIDQPTRKSLAANHSATHLLQAALRALLGNSVVQKGSSVQAENLRFDFTHHKTLTIEELHKIEELVNQQVCNNHPVITRQMDLEDALKEGAMALFTERYDSQVRVISMGSGLDNSYFSVELCGGTHVNRTGDIGLFKIIHESSVSSGVRRIIALTGIRAYEYIQKQESYLKTCSQLLKTQPEYLNKKILQLMEMTKHSLKKDEKDVPLCKNNLINKELVKKNIANIAYYVHHDTNAPTHLLKQVVDELKKQIGSGIVLVVQTEQKKVSILVGITDDITSRVSAVHLIRELSLLLGGNGGGGRSDLAQAGGPYAHKVPKIEKYFELALKKVLTKTFNGLV